MRDLSAANKENVSPQSSPSPTRSLRVSWSQSNLHHPYSLTVRSLPSSHKAKDPDKSILKKIPRPLLSMDNERQITPEPKDVLNDPLYLKSPMLTIVASLNDAADISLHDLREAYGVLTSRVKLKVQLDTVNHLCPIFQPLREHRDQLVEALERDLGRCFTDPLNVPAPLSRTFRDISDVPMSSSPLREGQRRGMNELEIKYARDLYTLCHGAMRLLSNLIAIPSLCEIFTEQQLSSLLTHLLAIPLASSLPTPNCRKTYALAIWVLQTQRLPLSVLDPAKPRITYALSRAIEGQLGKEGKKGAATDALKAVTDFLVLEAPIFLDSFVDLLPSVLLNLLSTVPSVRLQAVAALGSFAMAETQFLSQKAPYQDTFSAISRHMDQYVSQQWDDRKAVETCPLTKALRLTLSSEAVENKVGGPIWGLCVLASLIVLSGGQLFQRPRTLKLVLTAIRHATSHKVVSVRILSRLVWRCLIWASLDLQRATDQIEDVAARNEAQVKCESSWKIVRQIIDEGVGASVVMALLYDGSSRSVARILEVIELMVKSSGTSHADGIGILKHLVGGAKSPRNANARPLRPEEALIYCGFFDGSLMDCTPQSLGIILQIVSKCTSIQDARTFTPEEVSKHWSILLGLWQKALAQTEVWAKSTLATSILDVWRDLLLCQAHEGNTANAMRVNEQIHATLVSCLTSSVLEGFPTQQKFHIVFQLWTVIRNAFDDERCSELALTLLDVVAGMVPDSQEADAMECWSQLCANLLVVTPVSISRVWLQQTREDIDAHRRLWIGLARAWTACDSGNWELAVLLLQAPLSAWVLTQPEWDAWEEVLRSSVQRASGNARVLERTAETIGEATTISSVTLIAMTRLLSNLSVEITANLPEALLQSTARILHTLYPPTQDMLSDAFRFLGQIRILIANALPASVVPFMRHLHVGLCIWSQDSQRCLEDEQYSSEVLPLYTGCLTALSSASLTLDDIHTFASFLSSTFDRILPGAVGPTAFQQFWQGVYPSLGKSRVGYPEALIPCLKSLAETFGVDLGVSPETQISDLSPPRPAGPQALSGPTGLSLDPLVDWPQNAAEDPTPSDVAACIAEIQPEAPCGSNFDHCLGELSSGAGPSAFPLGNVDDLSFLDDSQQPPCTPPRAKGGLFVPATFSFVDTSVDAERVAFPLGPNPRPMFASPDSSPVLSSRSVLGKRLRSSSSCQRRARTKGSWKQVSTAREECESEDESLVEDSIVVSWSPSNPGASPLAHSVESPSPGKRMRMDAVELPCLSPSEKGQHVWLSNILSSLRTRSNADPASSNHRAASKSPRRRQGFLF